MIIIMKIMCYSSILSSSFICDSNWLFKSLMLVDFISYVRCLAVLIYLSVVGYLIGSDSDGFGWRSESIFYHEMIFLFAKDNADRFFFSFFLLQTDIYLWSLCFVIVAIVQRVIAQFESLYRLHKTWAYTWGFWRYILITYQILG